MATNHAREALFDDGDYVPYFSVEKRWSSEFHKNGQMEGNPQSAHPLTQTSGVRFGRFCARCCGSAKPTGAETPEVISGARTVVVVIL